MRKEDVKANTRYFRSTTRFFRVDSQWFYSTREGDEGPFPSEDAARQHLNRYLATEELKAMRSMELDKLKQERPKADPGVWDQQIDII